METNLNDGKCHGVDEIKNNGLEQSAKQFSEGNKLLEEILLNLWSLGIETLACCKGEHVKGHEIDSALFFRFPYIAIKVTEQTKEKVMLLIKILANEKGNSKPNITYKNTVFRNEQSSTLLIDRMFLSNANVNKMFKVVLSATEKMKTIKKVQLNEDVNLTTKLINYICTKELYRGQAVRSIHLKIAHNNSCSATFKDLQNKIKKKNINKQTIGKIKNFCDECLLDSDLGL